MKAPRRLLDESGDEFTRGLIDSALDDDPSEAAMARSAAALGVSLACTAGTTAAAATGQATGAAAELAKGGATKLAASAGATSAGTLTVAQWAGIGALAGLLAVGGAELVRGRDDGPPQGMRRAGITAVTTPTTSAAKAEVAPADAGAPAAPVPSVPRSDDLRRAPQGAGKSSDLPPVSPPSAEPAAGAEAAAPVVNGPTLAREIAEVDRARRALAAGDVSEALRVLDAYDRSTRTGVIETEAVVVRIEALVQSGRRAEASALARRLIAQSPSSPHARRLAALASESP